MSRKRTIHTAILTTICILHFFMSFGQGIRHERGYYVWFDQLVGIENTGLYNAIVYKQKYRTINEKTKFLSSPNFLKGSVIYDGQFFSNLEMKYDVFEDELLIKQKDRLGGVTLQLFKDKIAEFTIDDRRFVKIDEAPLETGISGFCEIFLKNEHLVLLAKHRKNRLKRKGKRAMYYEFIDQKEQYLLIYNDSYYKIKGKKDLTALFPEMKNEINSFYSVSRSLRNSNRNAFMKALMKRIEILMPSEEKTVTK